MGNPIPNACGRFMPKMLETFEDDCREPLTAADGTRVVPPPQLRFVRWETSGFRTQARLGRQF